jgi:hypothetical protein
LSDGQKAVSNAPLPQSGHLHVSFDSRARWKSQKLVNNNWWAHLDLESECINVWTSEAKRMDSDDISTRIGALVLPSRPQLPAPRQFLSSFFPVALYLFRFVHLAHSAPANMVTSAERPCKFQLTASPIPQRSQSLRILVAPHAPRSHDRPDQQDCAFGVSFCGPGAAISHMSVARTG